MSALAICRQYEQVAIGLSVDGSGSLPLYCFAQSARSLTAPAFVFAGTVRDAGRGPRGLGRVGGQKGEGGRHIPERQIHGLLGFRGSTAGYYRSSVVQSGVQSGTPRARRSRVQWLDMSPRATAAVRTDPS